MFEKLAGRRPEIMLNPGSRHFAVTVPVLPDGSVLFEVRADTLRLQPGEVSLPGGMVEAGETPQKAAVRETCEELLVAPGQLEVVAPLDVLPHLSAALIHPFLARLSGYAFTRSPAEVKAVFTVPLAFFLGQAPRVYRNTVTVTEVDPAFPWALTGTGPPYHWAKGTHEVLFYEYEGRVIWGLTARIIKNLVDLCREPA